MTQPSPSPALIDTTGAMTPREARQAGRRVATLTGDPAGMAAAARAFLRDLPDRCSPRPAPGVDDSEGSRRAVQAAWMHYVDGLTAAYSAGYRAVRDRQRSEAVA